MDVTELIDKYKHMDSVLSDPDFAPEPKDCDGCKLGRVLARTLRDMWRDVKALQKAEIAQ